MDQELDRILGDGYVAGLTERSVAELRSSRAECQALEAKLSFLRRLVQGRHDIVTGERDRRLGGGDPGDVASLVDRLPEILADRVRAPGPGRLITSLEPGEPSGKLVEQLDTITAAAPLDTPEAVSDEALETAAVDLEALEAEVSRLRRAMFERIDAIETELTNRYRDGEAHVDDLLAARGDAEA